MMIETNKDIYAFDDCSILGLCEIKIPKSYQYFFDKHILSAENCSKLKTAMQKLDANKIQKFRFVPSENMEGNIIKVADQILEGYNIQILSKVFKAEVIEQLGEFNDQIQENFKEIAKDENIGNIKRIFVENEKELIKEKNIPEDDDLKIIAGYQKHDCGGNKYCISKDEHFWGYDDLILKNFNINVIKEWKCHLIEV